MITAVFFDVGETLFDESRVWAQLGRLAGVEPHVIWAGLGAVIEARDHHTAVFERLGLEHPGSDAVGWEAGELYPDAAPCLQELRRRGYFLGLAGNVGTELGPWVAAQGIDVDFLGSSTTLGVEKPAPGFFTRLVDAAARPPEQCAYVGDRIDNDVVPAADAGLVAVHLVRGPWGYLQRGRPEASRATFRIGSLAELPDVLAGV